MSTRFEHDTMGGMAVPDDALYGAQTARAVQNFPISSLRLQRSFIRALGMIKAAAARVNGRHGWLDPPPVAAIEEAASRVANGDYDAWFVVDVFQTGSGTSTNMNANEVIAHLAGLHVNGVHPNDDVNRDSRATMCFPLPCILRQPNPSRAGSCPRWKNWAPRSRTRPMNSAT